EGAIESLLAPIATAVERAFARVRGAVQFTLRVRGKAAPRPRASTKAGPGTRWLEDRRALRAVPEIAPIEEATRPWVRAVVVERGRDPRLLATVFHLVAR